MSDKKITGFIAGCFDIIHPGYIMMIEDARRVCNNIVVALHEDPSIERDSKYKPINSVKDREMVLMSLKGVDEVVHYKTEEGLVDLLKQIEPDYRVMGTDYKGKKFTGDDLGIKTYWHERNHTHSYSNLRNKIRDYHEVI